MRVSKLWVLGLLALVACNRGGGHDNDDSTDPDDPNPNLPDPRDEVGGPESKCDGYTDPNDVFTPVAGATTYFIGEYTFDGDDVRGEEVWILYANDEWVENGGYDCEIHWSVAGTKGDLHSCGSCAYGIEIHADPVESLSTCVQGLYDYEGVPFDVTYDVRELGGDQIEVLFGGSGSLLATGYADESGLVWTTESDCAFF